MLARYTISNSAILFPTSLPSPILPYQRIVDPSFYQYNDFASGLPRTRILRTQRIDIHNVTWKFTQSQARTFLSWFTNTKLNNTFLIELLADDGEPTQFVAQFLENPSLDNLNNEGRVVTVEARLAVVNSSAVVDTGLLINAVELDIETYRTLVTCTCLTYNYVVNIINTLGLSHS